MKMLSCSWPCWKPRPQAMMHDSNVMCVEPDVHECLGNKALCGSRVTYLVNCQEASRFQDLTNICRAKDAARFHVRLQGV